jgi:hypothetical protein
MKSIRSLRSYDRISVGLIVTALLSVSAAAAVLHQSSASAIPDRLLDRVRGGNPSYVRAINQYQNCTIWNVDINNESGGTLVPYTDCIPAGATCIQCVALANYVLNPGPGSPLAWPKPIQAIDCNNPGGNQGTCTLVSGSLVCNLSAAYNCDQYAQKWSLEP